MSDANTGQIFSVWKSPRYVIRGSDCPRNGTYHENSSDEDVKCSFDWYRATSAYASKAVEKAFIEQYGGCFEDRRGLYSYTNAHKHDKYSATIMWGGENGGSFFEVSGASADKVAHWFRHLFPNHRVSRADVAFDFLVENGFNLMNEILEPIARKAGVACRFIGDPAENFAAFDEPNINGVIKKRKGRSMYYGSRTSELMTRLYEKGIKEKNEGNKSADPRWVRFEVEVKPKKKRKYDAAKREAIEMVGYSKWISKALSELLHFKPLLIQRETEDKHELSAITHMSMQYHKAIRHFVETRGWMELCEFLYIDAYSLKERMRFEEKNATSPVRQSLRNEILLRSRGS